MDLLMELRLENSQLQEELKLKNAQIEELLLKIESIERERRHAEKKFEVIETIYKVLKETK
jgi:hypothetical protein